MEQSTDYDYRRADAGGLPSLAGLEELVGRNSLLPILGVVNRVVLGGFDCLFQLGYLSEILSKVYSLYFRLSRQHDKLDESTKLQKMAE